MSDHPTRTLLITDSPAKKRTIANLLGNDFVFFSLEKDFLEWSRGAYRSRTQESILSEYQLREKQEETFKQLKKLAANCSSIMLATAPDNEGEFTAYQIAERLKAFNSSIYRLFLPSLTSESLLQALRQYHQINIRQVSAHHFYKLVDRFFKTTVTPILRKTLSPGLTFGYPEAFALQRLCQREAQLKRYRSARYWNIFIHLMTKNGTMIPAELIAVNGHSFPGEPGGIFEASEARRHSKQIREKTVHVAAIHTETIVQHPPAPFNLSTLLEEAGQQAGMEISRVISAARELYQGIDLGERGTSGLITCFKTQSTAVDNNALQELREYIVNSYGVEYLLPQAARFPNKRRRPTCLKGIRPTHISSAYEPKKLKSYLSGDQFKIYELIWKRFIASQMKSASGEKITVDFEADEYRFRTCEESLTFRGFLQIWPLSSSFPAGEGEAPSTFAFRCLRVLRPLEPLNIQTVQSEEHSTPPPPRYTEGMLVSGLINCCCGGEDEAPQIIRLLLEHRYVEKVDHYLVPTELGMAANALLQERFPELLTIKFATSITKKLKKIESGGLSWRDAAEHFFHQINKLPGQTFNNQAVLGRKTAPAIATEDICKQCSSPMVVKRGRFGEFLACSRYPSCHYTRALGTGVACPEEGCRGTIVQRLSRKGKIFYGCSEYPACLFALRDHPTDQPCPECHYPLLAQTGNPREGFYLQCPECRHKELLATTM